MLFFDSTYRLADHLVTSGGGKEKKKKKKDEVWLEVFLFGEMVQVIWVTPTGVAHGLSGNFLVAAATAEDLTAESTVVASAEGGELLVAVVTLLTLAVGHPVLLQVAVLERNKSYESQSRTSECSNEGRTVWTVGRGGAVVCCVTMTGTSLLLHFYKQVFFLFLSF